MLKITTQDFKVATNESFYTLFINGAQLSSVLLTVNDPYFDNIGERKYRFVDANTMVYESLNSYQQDMFDELDCTIIPSRMLAAISENGLNDTELHRVICRYGKNADSKVIVPCKNRKVKKYIVDTDLLMVVRDKVK